MRILFFQDEDGLVKQLCLSHCLGADFLNTVTRKIALDNDDPIHLLVPDQWLKDNPALESLDLFGYRPAGWHVPDTLRKPPHHEIQLLNGRILFTLDEKRVTQSLKSLSWDAVSIQITEDLKASQEIVKLTSQANVVGFRRCYANLIEPAEAPYRWPDLMIFKKSLWCSLCKNPQFPLDYQLLQKTIQQHQAQQIDLYAGGQIRDWNSESVILDCLDGYCQDNPWGHEAYAEYPGPVKKGKDVIIEPDVTIIGPVILCDNVHIKSGAVVRRSIIAENTIIKEKQVVNNRILFSDSVLAPLDSMQYVSQRDRPDTAKKDYRSWPLCSYARFGKRLFDIGFSLAVLVLLIPVFIVVALVIKVHSPGPIFYRARRQGLRGKEFDCLKFRSMMMQADSIQERLRVVNQVDGPQFKMDNDPRITGIGKFLRDTCIDELPQFLNVLFGQMSIVGPRPSPENENESSPAWRDARLSVRPGITGLWQVLRTRGEGADFQEWVHYDTQYVRNLSFHKDLWICWKTFRQLLNSFLAQF